MAGIDCGAILSSLPMHAFITFLPFRVSRDFRDDRLNQAIDSLTGTAGDDNSSGQCGAICQQIPLVVDQDFIIEKWRGDCCRIREKGGIDEMNAEIGLFCRMPCAPHSLLLHRIGCFPEAGRVNDAEGIAAEACLLLDRVARGARCLVHDSPLSSK